MNIDELVARESVRDVYARYNRSGDKGRLDELAACFTPLGVLDVAGHFVARGREEIVRHLQASAGPSRWTRGGAGRPVVRHFLASLRFDEVGPDLVRSSAYFLVCAADAVDHWGTYRDVLVSTETGWLFESRSVSVDGTAELVEA